MSQEHIGKIIDSIGICGCGTPEDALWAIRRTLNVAKAHNLGKFTEDPFKRLALDFLTQKSLIEHGGSIGGSWLRPEGERVLAFLEHINCRTDYWQAASVAWMNGIPVADDEPLPRLRELAEEYQIPLDDEED